jgi:hypothetical protein
VDVIFFKFEHVPFIILGSQNTLPYAIFFEELCNYLNSSEYVTTIILGFIVECKSSSSSSRLQTMKKLCCKFHFLQQQQ